ncbi:MAG: VOC family protein [Bacteroidia bacterium]|nr:VOC family protein [Bacteroidia bacterium]MBT8278299.1 VOC family protein [Bacteroidia bacterium]NNK60046.1 VOC family protein [Flavobacteriaceae bacterium]NNL32717.1 VOC family protein [Flavobacteriaceae bacterium]RZW53660.1 MAG: VOC family protein [Flavobacteriaceae bacterium]
MNPFEINFLDHVAIYVEDMDRSIDWYQRVMGLKKYQLEQWGAYPVFMLSGKSGLAIFPAHMDDPKFPKNSRHISIEHFAFNVSHKNFTKAQEHFKDLNETFTFQDHHYFHSIYLKDPDGHKVELTTLMIDEKDFY